MHAPIKITCPYCKTEQEIWTEVKYTGTNRKTIFLCDNEDMDGCGEEFIIEPVVAVTANIYKIVVDMDGDGTRPSGYENMSDNEYRKTDHYRES